jgi:hypothetical protein
MLITADQIPAFRLLALRSMLKLEAKGMKRRGPSALSIVKAETGLKARTAAAMLPLFEAWLDKRGVGAPPRAGWRA